MCTPECLKLIVFEERDVYLILGVIMQRIEGTAQGSLDGIGISILRGFFINSVVAYL